jgi:nucleoside-diphosphate-sugar epimerase
MKVLLTGASGFIGRHTIPFLLEQGYEVFAVSRSGKPLVDRRGLHWLGADLLKSGEVERLVQTVCPTHLLHLAWEATPRKYWQSPANYRWVEASLSLFRTFAEQGGKRAVGTGTCAEYDWMQAAPYRETSTSCQSHSPYSLCKHALYSLLTGYCRAADVSFAWGRPFFLFGPHEAPNRLVPQVMTSLLKHESVACSEGRQIRDFLYVEDAAEAFVALLASDVEGAVNVASGHGISVRGLVEEIAEHLNSRDLVRFGANQPDRPEAPNVVADIGRLVREVGYRPRTALNPAIDRTNTWWRTAMAKVDS